MTRRLLTVAREATPAEAVDLFPGQRVSCLPVIDRQRRPVGVLSGRDLLRALRPA
jgi:acetoin utilization protein AcuB